MKNCSEAEEEPLEMERVLLSSWISTEAAGA